MEGGGSLLNLRSMDDAWKMMTGMAVASEEKRAEEKSN